MRLLLFSLFLVSVSARSAPISVAQMNVTGVDRAERGEVWPDDCCEPHETPCWWDLDVHCYQNEWVLAESDEGCVLPHTVFYECCGRCECTREDGRCHESNKPEKIFNPSRP